MEKKFMYVDDIAVELNGEKNVLEVIRKAGIDMPSKIKNTGPRRLSSFSSFAAAIPIRKLTTTQPTAVSSR